MGCVSLKIENRDVGQFFFFISGAFTQSEIAISNSNSIKEMVKMNETHFSLNRLVVIFVLICIKLMGIPIICFSLNFNQHSIFSKTFNAMIVLLC